MSRLQALHCARLGQLVTALVAAKQPVPMADVQRSMAWSLQQETELLPLLPTRLIPRALLRAAAGGSGSAAWPSQERAATAQEETREAASTVAGSPRVDEVDALVLDTLERQLVPVADHPHLFLLPGLPPLPSDKRVRGGGGGASIHEQDSASVVLRLEMRHQSRAPEALPGAPRSQTPAHDEPGMTAGDQACGRSVSPTATPTPANAATLDPNLPWASQAANCEPHARLVAVLYLPNIQGHPVVSGGEGGVAGATLSAQGGHIGAEGVAVGAASALPIVPEIEGVENGPVYLRQRLGARLGALRAALASHVLCWPRFSGALRGDDGRHGQTGVKLLLESARLLSDKGLVMERCTVRMPPGHGVREFAAEFVRRLQARAALRLVCVDAALEGGRKALLNYFTEEDMWASDQDDSSSAYLLPARGGILREKHLEEVPPLQRASSCPSDGFHNSELQGEAHFPHAQQSQLMHGERALYWLLVILNGRPESEDDGSDGKGGRREGETKLDAQAGLAMEDKVEVTCGVFRPFGLGPRAEWLCREVDACARDASRAILLTEMQESRRFDERLLPPVADAREALAPRGGADGEGAGVDLWGGKEMFGSAVRMGGLQRPSEAVEMEIEREREKIRDRKRGDVEGEEGPPVAGSSPSHRGGGGGGGGKGTEVNREDLWCPVVAEIEVRVHDRVSAEETLQALRTKILQPHALLDRTNVYLYQERGRERVAGSIFFMLASIQEEPAVSTVPARMPLLSSAGRERDSPKALPASEPGAADTTKADAEAEDAELVTVIPPVEEVAVDVNQLNARQHEGVAGIGGLAAAGVKDHKGHSGALIVFRVHGIAPPSPELTEQFAGVLQSNVDDMVQRRIATVWMDMHIGMHV